MARDKSKKLDFKYFCKNDRFIDFLKNTEVRKDIYCSKEAFISLTLALVILFTLTVAFLNGEGIEKTSANLKELLGILIGGLFGMLGFIIGGLALVVGTLNTEEVKLIDKKDKFKSLLGILFRFYFVGMITAITIFLSTIAYIFLLIRLEFQWYLVVVFTFILLFFIVFSILSAVMLMGSCIRLLFVKISVSNAMDKLKK